MVVEETVVDGTVVVKLAWFVICEVKVTLLVVKTTGVVVFDSVVVDVVVVVKVEITEDVVGVLYKGLLQLSVSQHETIEVVQSFVVEFLHVDEHEYCSIFNTELVLFIIFKN